MRVCKLNGRCMKLHVDEIINLIITKLINKYALYWDERKKKRVKEQNVPLFLVA